MSVELGVQFACQDPPHGERIVQRWQEILEMAAVADRAGVGFLTVPEHHLMDDAYLNAPFVALAAIAARTERIRVGTAITIGTLWHPVRLAEEIAMVDVLSQGRVFAGLGLGNYEPELQLFGLSKRIQVSRFEEILHFVRTALHEGAVTMHGKHFDFDDVLVTPRPVQERVPLWAGGMSEPGVKRAARLGFPLLMDPLNTITDQERTADLYRSTCTKHGTTPEIILMRYGWIGDRDEIERDWWPHLQPTIRRYLFEIPRFALDPRFGDGTDMPFDAIAEDRLLVGSADEVAQKIDNWCGRVGATRMHARFQGATGPWGDRFAQCLTEYGRLAVAA
jgi:alkanesulfonate monooxygenase SsuD/methylene tetrahydromethanopterin reductase-like flavin-dependent oxidoreductase (luciferase family)